MAGKIYHFPEVELHLTYIREGPASEIRRGIVCKRKVALPGDGEAVAVLDQWYEPEAAYFKVKSTEGKTYLLRYDGQADELFEPSS